MLVICRRVGEAIVIGDSIEIRILETAGKRVKVGIEAPREIAVLRREIAVTIQENRTAAGAVSEEALSDVLEFYL